VDCLGQACLAALCWSYWHKTQCCDPAIAVAHLVAMCDLMRIVFICCYQVYAVLWGSKAFTVQLGSDQGLPKLSKAQLACH